MLSQGPYDAADLISEEEFDAWNHDASDVEWMSSGRLDHGDLRGAEHIAACHWAAEHSASVASMDVPRSDKRLRPAVDELLGVEWECLVHALLHSSVLRSAGAMQWLVSLADSSGGGKAAFNTALRILEESMPQSELLAMRLHLQSELPDSYTVLIEHRDAFMANQLWEMCSSRGRFEGQASPRKIVVVVGDNHVEGIRTWLQHIAALANTQSPSDL